jgi:hypothetical protein
MRSYSYSYGFDSVSSAGGGFVLASSQDEAETLVEGRVPCSASWVEVWADNAEESE